MRGMAGRLARGAWWVVYAVEVVFDVPNVGGAEVGRILHQHLWDDGSPAQHGAHNQLIKHSHRVQTGAGERRDVTAAGVVVLILL